MGRCKYTIPANAEVVVGELGMGLASAPIEVDTSIDSRIYKIIECYTAVILANEAFNVDWALFGRFRDVAGSSSST